MIANPRFYWLSERFPGTDPRRIPVIIGARQTGKTTPARAIYPKRRSVHLDDVDPRRALGHAAGHDLGRAGSAISMNRGSSR